VLRTQFDKDFSFFYVELPDGTIFSHLVEENERFPAQFGREVSYLLSILCIASKYAYFFPSYFPQKIEFSNIWKLTNKFQYFIFDVDVSDFLCTS